MRTRSTRTTSCWRCSRGCVWRPKQIRDSLLAAAGKLDDKVGGPSVFPPVPKGLNAGNLWQVSKDPQRHQPPQPLYLHAAERRVSAARGLQHGLAAAGPQPARGDDHAAAGADALQQRSGVRMVAGAGRPGDPRSRQRRIGAAGSALPDRVRARAGRAGEGDAAGVPGQPRQGDRRQGDGRQADDAVADSA